MGGWRGGGFGLPPGPDQICLVVAVNYKADPPLCTKWLSIQQTAGGGQKKMEKRKRNPKTQETKGRRDWSRHGHLLQRITSGAAAR